VNRCVFEQVCLLALHKTRLKKIQNKVLQTNKHFETWKKQNLPKNYNWNLKELQALPHLHKAEKRANDQQRSIDK